MAWRIEWTSKYSISNWITDMQLHCEPKWKIGLLGFLLFLGKLIGSIFINPLGDIWGRSITYRLSMTLSILSNLLLVIAKDIYVLYISLFIFGFASSGRSAVGHIWLMEHLPREN